MLEQQSVCVVEIRTEAVMQALALHKKPVVPLPSKRTSVQYPGQQQRPRERHGSVYLITGFYMVIECYWGSVVVRLIHVFVWVL